LVNRAIGELNQKPKTENRKLKTVFAPCTLYLLLTTNLILDTVLIY